MLARAGSSNWKSSGANIFADGWCPSCQYDRGSLSQLQQSFLPVPVSSRLFWVELGWKLELSTVSPPALRSIPLQPARHCPRLQGTGGIVLVSQRQHLQVTRQTRFGSNECASVLANVPCRPLACRFLTTSPVSKSNCPRQKSHNLIPPTLCNSTSHVAA